jgi:UDP-N-acetylmuramate dehydrogenase
MSRFKRQDANRFVVCAVTFRLRADPPRVKYPDVADYLDRAGVTTPTVSDVRRAVLAIRRRKGMVVDPVDPDTRSVGSFFMNPIVSASERDRLATASGVAPPAFPAGSGQVKLSAAWLIERAGIHRGHRDGAVGISTKHSLAIVNRGGATARDVLRFAAHVKRRVLDQFGINLRPEPVFVGFGPDDDLDFLRG